MNTTATNCPQCDDDGGPCALCKPDTIAHIPAADLSDLLSALADVVSACEQLAEQQAMLDDFWVGRVDFARRLLREYGR